MAVVNVDLNIVLKKSEYKRMYVMLKQSHVEILAFETVLVRKI